MASNYEQELWEEGRRTQAALAQKMTEPVRTFTSGATRNAVEGRPDPEGFISPWVLERYGEYMNRNRFQPDGNVRDSDNWQLGIPKDAYMKSKVRHALTTWKLWRGGVDQEGHDLETSLCAELFNTMGLLHELLKERNYGREPTKSCSSKEAA